MRKGRTDVREIWKVRAPLYPQHVGVVLFWLVSAVDGESRLTNGQIEFVAERAQQTMYS